MEAWLYTTSQSGQRVQNHTHTHPTHSYTHTHTLIHTHSYTPTHTLIHTLDPLRLLQQKLHRINKSGEGQWLLWLPAVHSHRRLNNPAPAVNMAIDASQPNT